MNYLKQIQSPIQFEELGTLFREFPVRFSTGNDLYNYDKAISDYTQATTYAPEFSQGFLRRGSCYYAQRKYSEAIKDFTTAIALESEAAYLFRANCYYSIEDYSAAIEDYSEFLEIFSGHAKAYFRRGKCYLEKQEEVKADEDFNQSLFIAYQDFYQSHSDSRLLQTVHDDIVTPQDIYWLQKRASHKNQEQIIRLQKILRESKVPVIYVEGETDEMILTTAWKKLYGQIPMPFVIKSCDLKASTGGNAGVGILVKTLSTIRADSRNIAIGLLDHDGEAMQKFNAPAKKGGLPEYFLDIPGMDWAKYSRHRKAAVALLPVPHGKELFARYHNLCVEYYFSDSVLSQKTSTGKSLRFAPFPTRSYTVGGVTETIVIEKKEARAIEGGKKEFAENIVPAISASEFELFRSVFGLIERILKYLQENTDE